MDYLHCKGLGGAMMFSLYDLDPGATLFHDVVNGLASSPSSLRRSARDDDHATHHDDHDDHAPAGLRPADVGLGARLRRW